MFIFTAILLLLLILLVLILLLLLLTRACCCPHLLPPPRRHPLKLAPLRGLGSVASQAVDAFNSANRFRKRGLSLMPTKYGMSPGEYRVGALLNVYACDGSVEVFHSGAEIGQGINTKVAQAVAMRLGVPLSMVRLCWRSACLTPGRGTCLGGGR